MLGGELAVDLDDAAAKLLERLRDVDLLLLQRRDALGELLARVNELVHAAVVNAIEIEDAADFREREPAPASAQDENDAGAVALRIDARLSAAFRRDQAFIFIETQRTRGDGKFLGELTNSVGAIGGCHLLPFRGLRVLVPNLAAPSDNFSVLNYCLPLTSTSSAKKAKAGKVLCLTGLPTMIKTIPPRRGWRGLPCP